MENNTILLTKLFVFIMWLCLITELIFAGLIDILSELQFETHLYLDFVYETFAAVAYLCKLIPSFNGHFRKIIKNCDMFSIFSVQLVSHVGEASNCTNF